MTVAMSDRAAAAQSPSSPADRSISVIVTAMNEEGNLRPAVEAVACAVAPRFLRYEIIIVDDGSTDRTPEVARSLVAGDARIRVHRNVRNLGVGRSYASRVIQTFKAEGVLETRRGSILVRNREALQARACLCNDSVKNHFEEVLRGVYPTEEGHGP